MSHNSAGLHKTLYSQILYVDWETTSKRVEFDLWNYLSLEIIDSELWSFDISNSFSHFYQSDFLHHSNNVLTGLLWHSLWQYRTCWLHYRVNRKALTVFHYFVKHLWSSQSTHEVGAERHSTMSGVCHLHFFHALATSCMLYNRTKHSQGFFIC